MRVSIYHGSQPQQVSPPENYNYFKDPFNFDTFSSDTSVVDDMTTATATTVNYDRQQRWVHLVVWLRLPTQTRSNNSVKAIRGDVMTIFEWTCGCCRGSSAAASPHNNTMETVSTRTVVLKPVWLGVRLWNCGFKGVIGFDWRVSRTIWVSSFIGLRLSIIDVIESNCCKTLQFDIISSCFAITEQRIWFRR